MSKKDKNTIIKGDGEEGGHLAVLTHYLMIIVPFVCKLVFETVQNLKHLSNDAAQKYAMKSGFWDENEENNFNNCFEYNNKQFQQMNSSNSCNLENDMLNSYLDKILTIGSKVSRNNSENKNTMNTFEFEAIREIMECLADGRLDIKYLNEHLINQSNVEKFIESWARQLKNDYNTNNEIKFDKKVYENPLLYINGLFSKDYVKQQKFKQSMQVIKRNLSHVKNDTKFKALINTLISDSENQTIKNVLKAIQSDKFNILDSIIPSNKKNKNLKIKSKGEKMKELITKKFKQKIDLKQNELMNLCDEAFKEKSFPFPKFTLQNKKKIITEIPQWEIEELFQKYIQKSGVKVKDDNQS